MARHDYSPRDALDLLIRTVASRDSELARDLQSAIDAGKDVSERENAIRRRKPRFYRRKVRFTDEEAIRIAIEVLQAHFVEQPQFVNSAAHQFAAAAIGDRVEPWRTRREKAPVNEGVGLNKPFEIEIQTETRISEADQQTFRLIAPSQDLLRQQEQQIARLLELASFE
jgi:hypothetical protein